jgi:hypothetical protein
MLRTALFSLFLAGCTGATTPAGGPAEQLPFEASDLVGQWACPCVDPGTGQGITLDFDLTAGDWALDYAVFGDASCEVPFLTVRIDGPYSLGEASEHVQGARDGEFLFSTKTVTPHSADAVGFLESEYGCNTAGFEVGVAADLSRGCAGLGQYPLAECDRDHDVVLLEGDALRFGLRPADNDMCTPERRPTEASPLAMERQG